jgi:hypothetical protein
MGLRPDDSTFTSFLFTMASSSLKMLPVCEAQGQETS